MPVYQLLGGKVRDRIKVYNGVYTAPDVPLAVEALDELNKNWGFKAFKLSPWRNDMHANRWGEVVRASAEYFRQLREAADPTYEIAFDAHARIFEPVQARQLGNALAPYDPLFLEEPLRPENIDAWGELKQGLECRLATGESLYNRFEFLRLLQAKGADLIQPDICVVGGITEMRRIATIAEAHYVTVAPHNPMGPLATAVNLHFAAATHNFTILEYRLPDGDNYIYGGTELQKKTDSSRYVVDPYLPVDGYLQLREDRPGWGVDIDLEFISTDQYVHWERRVPKRPDGSYAYV